jgi:hypothetical protein
MFYKETMSVQHKPHAVIEYHHHLSDGEGKTDENVVVPTKRRFNVAHSCGYLVGSVDHRGHNVKLQKHTIFCFI